MLHGIPTQRTVGNGIMYIPDRGIYPIKLQSSVEPLLHDNASEEWAKTGKPLRRPMVQPCWQPTGGHAVTNDTYLYFGQKSA